MASVKPDFSSYLNNTERKFIQESKNQIQTNQKRTLLRKIRERTGILLLIFTVGVALVFFNLNITTNEQRSKELLQIARSPIEKIDYNKLAEIYEKIYELGYDRDSILSYLNILASKYILQDSIDAIIPLLKVVDHFDPEIDEAKQIYGEIAFLNYMGGYYKKIPGILPIVSNLKIDLNKEEAEKMIITYCGEEIWKNLIKKYVPEMIHVESKFDPSVNKDYFLIGKYEITNIQFAAFLNIYKSPRIKSGPYKFERISAEHVLKDNDVSPNLSFGQLPAMTNWYGAYAYCQWIGGRLPTEVEWNFAARGGLNKETYKFSGSDRLEEVAWFLQNTGGKPQPVGSKMANSLGIYDMTGNVYEWVAGGSNEKRILLGGSCGTPHIEEMEDIDLVNGFNDIKFLEIGKSLPMEPIYSQNMGFRVVMDPSLVID